MNQNQEYAFSLVEKNEKNDFKFYMYIQICNE